MIGEILNLFTDLVNANIDLLMKDLLISGGLSTDEKIWFEGCKIKNWYIDTDSMLVVLFENGEVFSRKIT